MRRIVYLAIGLFSIACFSRLAAQSNERILFTHEGDIWMMHPDGSDPVNLTNTPEKFEVSPNPSADGRLITYSGTYSSLEQSVWVMNADGTSSRELEATRDADEVGSPTFSPDGRRILYWRIGFESEEFDSTITGFAMINTDGTDLDFLHVPGIRVPGEPHFSWSPIIDKIVFAFQSESSRLDIWVVNSDGTNITQLTNHLGQLKENPLWSPDGTRIAYTVGRRDIYIINADGSNPINITANFPSVERVPCWSPDGTQIAFTSDRDGLEALYIMNSDGSNPQRVNGLARYCEGWFSTTVTATQVSPRSWGAIKRENGKILNE